MNTGRGCNTKMIQKIIQKLRNRKIIRYYSVLLALGCAFFLLPAQASAAEASCSVSVPVQTEVTGETDERRAPSSEFTVVLEAEAKGVPMPEITSLTMKNNDRAQFGPITYTVPGDYVYRVYQKPGTAKNFTYDQSVYTVTVRVVNTEDGGIAAEIWAIRDGGQNKVDEILFTNQWSAPEVPDNQKPEQSKGNVKTGDDAQFCAYLLLMLASAAVVLVFVKKNITVKNSLK